MTCSDEFFVIDPLDLPPLADAQPPRTFTYRDYQDECIQAVESAWPEFKRLLIVLCTGGGKTIIFTRIAQLEVARGGKVLILDMIIDDPENPNFDYLSHYILGAGLPFSVLGYKQQSRYKEILESIGFTNVRTIRKYDHLLCEAEKPA